MSENQIDLNFGQRLRQLRTEKQIRQGQLAQRVAISPAYLSDIERGRRNPPSDAVIRQWAGVLDVGQADQIGDELVELAARARSQTVNETVKVVVGEESASPEKKGNPASATPFIDHFGTDLIELARDGGLAPAEERRDTFAAIGSALARMRQNSVALSGPSSADTTRTLHGLAHALAAGEGLPVIKDRRLMSIQGIQAGVKYRGQFEERLHTLLAEAQASGTLLHFFSLADIAEAEQAANGSYFAPALLEGKVQILTCARPDQWAYCRRINSGLAEAFKAVELLPLDSAGVHRGLFSERQRYAAHHGVTYTDEAIEAVVTATAGTDAPWHRALDLLDQAGVGHGSGAATQIGAAEIEKLI
jgi:ATP-dependent Clp protease ATP-binding subunit ClpA